MTVNSFLLFFSFLVCILMLVKTFLDDFTHHFKVGYPAYRKLKPLLRLFPTKAPLLTNELQAATFHLKDENFLKIEVKDLSLEISGKKILSHVSFSLNSNELVCLTGGVGAGKSSLIRLLLGLEEPSSGEIYLNGHKVEKDNFYLFKQNMCAILETSQIILGSLYYNICGANSYSEEEVWEVLKVCHLEKEIENLPMGLDTWVCEGGFTFSSTQKYLILLARALISKPKILFLDDIFNFLEEQIQSVVIENILKIKGAKIIVTHQENILKKADRILKLEEGRIIL